MMPPFVVSTLISPLTFVSSMSSLTEFTSIRPDASASVTVPWIECSVMLPLPPRTLTSPFTVSALIGPCIPSTLMSAYVPLRVSPMDWGTVMSKSITEGAPSRLLALTTTVFPTSETSTRPRRPVSACTFTRFSLQPWIVIPPPKLLTERLAPAGTAKVVSVCLCDASATSIAAASVAAMFVVLLGPCRGHLVHTPQQFHLAPHRGGEMEVQVRVAGVAAQRHARFGDRPIDDGEILAHDPHGRGVEPLLILYQLGLQIGNRPIGAARPIGYRGDRRSRPGHRGADRLLARGEPHAARRQQDQGDARREQLPDGQTETAADEAVTLCRCLLPANLPRDPRPQIGRRWRVFEPLRARDYLAQLAEHRVAATAGRKVGFDRGALRAVELAVDVFRKSVRPLIVHRSKCLRSAIRA